MPSGDERALASATVLGKTHQRPLHPSPLPPPLLAPLPAPYRPQALPRLAANRGEETVEVAGNAQDKVIAAGCCHHLEADG